MKELCETCKQCFWLHGDCDGCTEEEYNDLLKELGQDFINSCNKKEIW